MITEKQLHTAQEPQNENDDILSGLEKDMESLPMMASEFEIKVERIKEISKLFSLNFSTNIEHNCVHVIRFGKTRTIINCYRADVAAEVANELLSTYVYGVLGKKTYDRGPGRENG